MTSSTFPRVAVAGIDVVDLSLAGLVEALSRRSSAATLAFALHVGGLNVARRREVHEAYAAADVVYADGISVALLARLAGATAVERSATTDIASAVLRHHVAAGRRRVFLVGGPPGLALAAGTALTKDDGCLVVGTRSGYDLDLEELLEAIALAEPDVVIVGMGAPREMIILASLRDRLPPALYLTCGGWFGFLAGSETRAPLLARRVGLEWTWRLAQHPRRLLGRYAVGMWTVFSLACGLALSRLVERVRRVIHAPVR